MNKFEKLLRALLSKVYKKTDTEIEAILSNTDENAAETDLLEIDRARVSELQKPKPGQTFQDGYKKAKGEVLAQLEKEAKEKFGIDSDAQGLDLIDEIVTAKAGEGVKGDVSKLTTEDLKKLPQYQAIQREHVKQLNQAKIEAENRIKEIEAGYKKAEIFGSVAKDARSLLTSLNPVLPKDQKVADRQINAFLDTFKGYEWQDQDGVKVPVKDGQVATDSHGNALTLDDLVKTSAAEWFEFAANNGGANAGNGKAGEGSQGQQGAGTKAYPANVQKPKTFEELSTTLDRADIKAEDKQVILQTWETEQAAGTK